MKDVLYVPSLKKKLLSISALDQKGFRFAFIVLMWPKGNNIEDAIIIGEEEGGLYKLKGHSETTFVHESTNPSELWHRRCYHPPCGCLCEVDPGWMVEGQATKGWNHDCLDSQMDGCHANQGNLHFMLS